MGRATFLRDPRITDHGTAGPGSHEPLPEGLDAEGGLKDRACIEGRTSA